MAAISFEDYEAMILAKQMIIMTKTATMKAKVVAIEHHETAGSRLVAQRCTSHACPSFEVYLLLTLQTSSNQQADTVMKKFGLRSKDS